MFTWSMTLVVTLTSTNVHSHKYGGGSSVATVTCQYVRTSQKLSAECFAEKCVWTNVELLRTIVSILNQCVRLHISPSVQPL